jgi:pimeloyl-ACP methyl ester carboxylesterase
MNSLRFTAENVSDGIVERDFQLGDIPGVLWGRENGPAHAPLVLMGHGGGLHKKTPALAARARSVVAIDAPGHGDRPRTPEDDRARTELRQAKTTDDFRSATLRYTRTLVERAVPEWQATLDALQATPEIGAEAPIGYGGGISLGTAIGIPLTAADPRIRAAIFGGGFFVYDEALESARKITVPVQFLLPWDDEHVDRQSTLTLFDAFASHEKTLHANPGDRRTVRWVGIDDNFLPRHLNP